MKQEESVMQMMPYYLLKTLNLNKQINIYLSFKLKYKITQKMDFNLEYKPHRYLNEINKA